MQPEWYLKDDSIQSSDQTSKSPTYPAQITPNYKAKLQ